MHRQRPTASLALTLSLTCAACGENDAASTGRALTTRTDSAGIEIVVSEFAPAGAPVYAIVDSAPSLRIGSLDGPEEEQFGSIRALAPLRDGGIAVLDQQAAQVRLFGPEGAYRGAVGSKGEGPGELTSPASLALLDGDTLAVYDWRARRVTRYTLNGGGAQVRTLQGGGRAMPTSGSFFPDGRMVGSERWFAGTGGGAANEGEDVFAVDSAVIAVYTAEGAFFDTTTVIPNRERIQKWMRVGGGINVIVSSAAFSRTGVFAAHSDGIWAGFGDRWELRLHDPTDGRLRRILRAPALERALTTGEVEAVLAQAMVEDSTPAQRERREIWWDLSPRPEVRPTFDRLLVDDGDRLWLREWPGPGEGPQRWWVFAGAGDVLGSVDAPAGATVLAVSGGAAWAIVRDDFDVPYVVRHKLRVLAP